VARRAGAPSDCREDIADTPIQPRPTAGSGWAPALLATGTGLLELTTGTGRSVRRRNGHPHPQLVARVVFEARDEDVALVAVLDVVTGDAAVFAFDLDDAAAALAGLVDAVGAAVVLVDVAPDRAADDR